MKKVICILLILVSSFTVEAQSKDTVEASSKLISAIFDNVFTFFKLIEYETPLQKEMFKKTDEYKKYLDSIKQYKKSVFFVDYDSYANSGYNYKGDKLHKWLEYDIKQKGFKIYLMATAGANPRYDAPPSCIFNSDRTLYILLDNLTTINEPINGVKEKFIQWLFIPASEELALKIEKNKDNISLKFYFNYDTLKFVKYKFFKVFNDNVGTVQNLQCVNGTDVSIELSNTETGEVYYSKSTKSKNKSL